MRSERASAGKSKPKSHVDQYLPWSLIIRHRERVDDAASRAGVIGEPRYRTSELSGGCMLIRPGCWRDGALTETRVKER